MNFLGHRLLRDSRGYVLELYLDGSMEAAREWGQGAWGASPSLGHRIADYAARHLPGLRLQGVRLMVGSMLVASFTLATPKAVNQGELGAGVAPQGAVEAGIASQGEVEAGVAPGGAIEAEAVSRGAVEDRAIPQGAVGSAADSPRAGGAGAPSQGAVVVNQKEEVRQLQAALAKMGFDLPVDGVYSAALAETVRQIQLKYPPAAVDGLYGPETKAMIEAMLARGYRIATNPEDRLVLVNKSRGLPRDYVPRDLVQPAIPSVIQEDKPQKYLRREAARALEALVGQGVREGVELKGVSGYRSYDYQGAIFAANLAANPEANQRSARAGESEHQTGWAMDVSSPSVGYGLTQAFGDTAEGRWLAANAPRYGFVIRYPRGKEGITGYQYEPWHLRYVGVEAAQAMTREGLTLEEYLARGAIRRQ